MKKINNNNNDNSNNKKNAEADIGIPPPSHPTTNSELLVTLYSGRKPLTNIKKSSISDTVRVLYKPLKRLIGE